MFDACCSNCPIDLRRWWTKFNTENGLFSSRDLLDSQVSMLIQGKFLSASKMEPSASRKQAKTNFELPFLVL